MGNSKSSPVKIIACVGHAGSGKSRIIDCLAKTKWASESLQGGERKVRSKKLKFSGKTIVLVDTPGFDITTPDDVVFQLEDWLKKNYKQVHLTGVLYLHPISDNRMTKRIPSQLKNVLKQGSERVIIVTTMWDRVARDVAEGREETFKNKYLDDMIKLGAQMERFDNQEATARGIIDKLLETNVSDESQSLNQLSLHSRK